MDEVTRDALAARDGDAAALAAFVRATQPEVWRLCAWLADRQSADDLAQEVYLRAIGALPRFRGDAPARVWLLGIARRTVVDHLRRRTRGRLAFRRLGAPEDAVDGTGLVVLEDMLRRLPADRRQAFVLTQLAGLRYDEAAEVCGCPVGTIRSRVARARADLASWLALADTS